MTSPVTESETPQDRLLEDLDGAVDYESDTGFMRHNWFHSTTLRVKTRLVVHLVRFLNMMLRAR